MLTTVRSMSTSVVDSIGELSDMASTAKRVVRLRMAVLLNARSRSWRERYMVPIQWALPSCTFRRYVSAVRRFLTISVCR